MRTLNSKTTVAALALLLAGFCFTAAAQDQSIAEAARKAREQKKTAPQAKHVFTNDNIPTDPGAVSSVGSAPAPSGETTSGTSPTGARPGGGEGTTTGTPNPDEKAKAAEEEAKWRKKFAELRAKITTAEKEVDVMQRELNLKQQQYYSDPNTALREQYSRGDINETTKKIDDKKKEIEALKQQLTELEDDLRRAGLPSGWSRQP